MPPGRDDIKRICLAVQCMNARHIPSSPASGDEEEDMVLKQLETACIPWRGEVHNVGSNDGNGTILPVKSIISIISSGMAGHASSPL